MSRKQEADARKLPAINKRILIADDDASLRDIFSIIFQSAGYAIEIKANGNDLLNDNYVIPDLFLIDKQLSGLDGLNICKYLKSRSRTSHIPVIIVSATPDIAALALGAGADDYLEKPFPVSALLDKVAQHTSKKPKKAFIQET